jgi:hypothetical protein
LGGAREESELKPIEEHTITAKRGGIDRIAQDDGLGRSPIARVAIFVVGCTATIFPGWAMPDENASEPGPEIQESSTTEPQTHLSESLRSSVKKVVVLPSQSPASQAVTGSYEEETAGLIGGAQSGSSIGKGVGTDVGPVSVGVPFPILTLPGAVIGGISGKTKREIQEFRDELTDQLANAASQPLTNDALASDVFWGIHRLPNLDSKIMALTAPIPEDTDAILYVNLKDVTIDVEGKDAIITTSASATLRRLRDGEHLYENEVQYQDRDTLSNWTKDENALWRDYANFSRHYIGREISARVFDRIVLRHDLRPKETDTVVRFKKNDWQGVSRTLSPILAWELTLLGGDSNGAWAKEVDETNVAYDIEIYDMHRPIYSAKDIQGPSHAVTFGLEACKTYRWSVRPSFNVGGDKRFGEWMRFNSETHTSKANVGRKASVAPAYIQDFATLEIKCGSK